MENPDNSETEPEGNVAEFTVSELSFAIKRAIEDGFSYVRVRGELGRILVVDRTGAARENQPEGPHRFDLSRIDRAGIDLRKHTRLPDAPRNELRVLRSEIQDDDSLVHLVCVQCRVSRVEGANQSSTFIIQNS